MLTEIPQAGTNHPALPRAMLCHNCGGHLYSASPVSSPLAAARSRMLSPAQEARAKNMLRSKLASPISISEVAQACNLSRAYFTRAFKISIGQTPHHWLQSQRVQRAQTLLSQAELTLADIAAACGFADQSHMSRVFTKFIGMSPGKWRHQAQDVDPISH